jgi:hypothetical protein
LSEIIPLLISYHVPDGTPRLSTKALSPKAEHKAERGMLDHLIYLLFVALGLTYRKIARSLHRGVCRECGQRNPYLERSIGTPAQEDPQPPGWPRAAALSRQALIPKVQRRSHPPDRGVGRGGGARLSCGQCQVARCHAPALSYRMLRARQGAPCRQSCPGRPGERVVHPLTARGDVGAQTTRRFPRGSLRSLAAQPYFPLFRRPNRIRAAR